MTVFESIYYIDILLHRYKIGDQIIILFSTSSQRYQTKEQYDGHFFVILTNVS